MRLFVAIDLDDGARRAIEAEQQRVRKSLDPTRSLKWVPPAQMHVTLAFLGEVAEAAAPGIIDAISPNLDMSPFAAVFERFGVFPPRGRPRALWLGVGEGAAEVIEVRRRVADRLDRAGVALEPRPFHPHLTLARWRAARPMDARRALATDRHAAIVRLTVDHVTLYRSHLSSAGPAYTALARATLT